LKELSISKLILSRQLAKKKLYQMYEAISDCQNLKVLKIESSEVKELIRLFIEK